MKPPKQLREKFATNYYDKSSFASKARLLQSIWRTERGYEYDKESVYANYLQLDFAKESGANFFTNGLWTLKIGIWILGR